MSATTFLILVVIGLVAGFLSGMMGLGGAIILIPAMVLFLSMGYLGSKLAFVE